MALLKKEKQEKVALNLQNPANQKLAIRASLDYRIPMIFMGDGIYVLELKRVKEDSIRGFLRQLTTESETRIKGAIFREDPKCDFLVIYDEIKEE